MRVADDDNGVVGAATLLHRAKRVARHGSGIEVTGVGHDHGQQLTLEGLNLCLANVGIDRGP